IRTPDGALLHAMRGDRRYVTSLYEQRFQLSAVTLVVLTIGALLALWMGARMVGPIESLRDQVVDRTRGPVSTRPVVLERKDELGELASAFNELLRAIDERDRSNAAFAADLAHELKNPVAAVRAAAEALGSERPVEGERRDRLRRVLADSAARMEVVVHQFLELARAEAGLQDRERERVALLATCRSLVDGLRTDERFVDRRWVCEGEELAVDAVPERLETAVRNLLANAAHFARSEVTLTVRRAEDRAVIEVRDDGPGIAEEELPHVFDRYYTTREGGTGLGLALVKAIASAHGGSVEARSVPGDGATFRLVLPLAESAG
ncbi:MAG: HAMP domain-containing histidine kinase, partial [Alphaproteobacteria bacterium]|nr:HAMP domain-containing histidine kinase [Alphaproteobacteria bacterium]